MGKILENDRINLGLLFFKIQTYWYIFALFIPLTLIGAYFYARSLPKVYGFKSVLQLNIKETGLPNLDVLLLDVNEKITRERNIEDEIGIITSFDMVKKVIKRLDFEVFYYKGKEKGKDESYQGKFPFEVKIDTNAIQLADVPIFVEKISDTQCKISLKDEEVTRFDFKKEESLSEKIPNARVSEKITFGKPFKNSNLSFTIYLKDKTWKNGSKAHFIINNPNGLVKSYQSRLTIKPSARNSSLLLINLEGMVNNKEVNFLNTLMQLVIERNLEQKNLKGNKALALINKQIAETKNEIDNLENNIQSFRSENTILNPEKRIERTILNRDKYEEERDVAEVKLESYQNIYQTILRNERSNTYITPSNYNVSDATINTLLNNLNGLYQEKIANRNLTDENPTMIRINTQINSTTTYLKNYLQNNIEEIKRNIGRLNRKIIETKGLSEQIPYDDRTLEDLRRDLEFKKKSYNDLLAKQSETKIGIQTNISDANVIESAKKVGIAPIKPNTRFIYLITLLMGFTIPIGFIVLADLLNFRITSKEDLSETTQIPLLALITHGKKKVKIAAIEQPKSALAESFRGLQFKLEYLSANGSQMPHQVIGITSTISGEGKTFCAVNLSATYAVSGKKTLLIDADLHKEQMNSYFDLKGTGLSEYLSNTIEIDQIIQATKVPNLDIISSGSIASNPAVLLDNSKMAILMAELSKKYDNIILDIPPIGFVSDYFTIKNHIDTNLYIVRYNYTTRKLLGEINELHQEDKIKNLYLILNNAKYAQMYEFRFKDSKHAYYK